MYTCCLKFQTPIMTTFRRHLTFCMLTLLSLTGVQASVVFSSDSTSLDSAVYEAESAVINIPTSRMSRNFTGSSHLRGSHWIGRFVEFTVTVEHAGYHEVSLRYLAGDDLDRTFTVTVNGEFHERKEFPTTGSWREGWQYRSFRLFLDEGTQKIKFEKTHKDREGGMHIDHLVVESSALPSNHYEAEYGQTFTVASPGDRFPTRVWDGHRGYSGSGFVEQLKRVGDAISIEVEAIEAGHYTLTSRYSAGIQNGPKAGPRTMSIYVNDHDVAQGSYPITTSWSEWGISQVSIYLKKGKNLIKTQYDGDDSGWINLDFISLELIAVPPPIKGRYEAEDATTNAVFANQETGYSGSGYLEWFTEKGRFVTFNVNVPDHGFYRATLNYATGVIDPQRDKKNISLFVNDSKHAQLHLDQTDSWSTWFTHTEVLCLNTGDNTITYLLDAGDHGWINIDYLEIEETDELVIEPPIIEPPAGDLYEAEKGTTNLSVESQHMGFTGSGYLANMMQLGGYSAIDVQVDQEGYYEVSVRYSSGLNEGPRHMGAYVNDDHRAEVQFPGTGSWDAREYVTFEVFLDNGLNTLMLRYDREGNHWHPEAPRHPWDHSETHIHGGWIDIDHFILARTDTPLPIEGRYEAEDAISNAVFADNESGYSSRGYLEWFTEEGRFVTFDVDVQKEGYYAIDLNYASGVIDPTLEKKTISLYHNDEKYGQLKLDQTDSWSTWFQQSVPFYLDAGHNTITYALDANDHGWINIDYIDVAEIENVDSEFYEAEYASHNLRLVLNETHSNGLGFLLGTRRVGRFVSFTIHVEETGSYALDLRYTSGNDEKRTLPYTTFSLDVDGMGIGSLRFNETENWTNWNVQRTVVTLDSGSHTITYSKTESDEYGGIHIDYLNIEKVETLPNPQVWYEAEDANTNINISQGGTGYTGKGFLRGSRHTGKYAEFCIHIAEDGFYSLNLRYSANTGGGVSEDANRTFTLYHNDSRISSLPFPMTASWRNWEYNKTTIYFSKGRHRIRYQKNEEDIRGGIHMDHLVVEQVTKPSQYYEAEDGEHNLDVYSTNGYPGYTGRGYLGSMHTLGGYSSVEVEVDETGFYSVNVRYSAGFGDHARAVAAYVNGDHRAEVIFPSTIEWGTREYKSFDVFLEAGVSKIMLRYDREGNDWYHEATRHPNDYSEEYVYGGDIDIDHYFLERTTEALQLTEEEEEQEEEEQEEENSIANEETPGSFDDIFPNPAEENWVSFDYDGEAEIVEVTILNSSGKVMFTYALPANSRINLEGMESGLYYLVLNDGNESESFRLIVK